ISAGGSPVAIVRLSVGRPPPAAGPAAEPADTAGTAVAAQASQSLFVELAPTPRLTPGAEYTVLVFGLTNLVGLSADIEAVVQVPAAEGGPGAPEAPPAPADTAAPAAPADTARAAALQIR